MAVDWLAIRNDYINGGGSYRKLAEKYGVPFGSLRGRAEKEKWAEQKEAHLHDISTKTAQKTQEKISDALSDKAATNARIAAKMTRMVESWLDRHEDADDAGDIRRMVQNCVDMGVFAGGGNAPGDTREDDPLTKALKEEAERMNNADQS